MSYHAIGKQGWDELPNIFGNSELAAALEADPTLPRDFWCYMYMFPSTAQPGRTCVMDAGIRYSSLTGLFTKYIKSSGVE